MSLSWFMKEEYYGRAVYVFDYLVELVCLPYLLTMQVGTIGILCVYIDTLHLIHPPTLT